MCAAGFLGGFGADPGQLAELVDWVAAEQDAADDAAAADGA